MQPDPNVFVSNIWSYVYGHDHGLGLGLGLGYGLDLGHIDGHFNVNILGYWHRLLSSRGRCNPSSMLLYQKKTY